MLHFTKYEKKYGRSPVLKIEDLTIPPGIYWIKGANGSGKSTLLKTLAGIIPFEGDITLNEKISIKKHPVEYRKLVNFAEAEPLFPSFLTGKEMIGLFSSSKRGRSEQAGYLTSTMNVESYMDAPIRTYSSGMIKKLSLVLAFLGTPSVILLDEPLITIDTESLKILTRWIMEEHHQKGTTFLLSSHQVLDNDILPVSKEIFVKQQGVKLID